MRELRQKSQFRKIFFSRIVFLFFFVLTMTLVMPVFNAYKKGQDAVSRNEFMEDELVKTQKRKNELEASINQLKTDLGIEKELRKKFSVKKPDEEFVVIIDTGSDEEVAQEWQVVQENLTFWQKLLNLFK